jgi:hypothetical protein
MAEVLQIPNQLFARLLSQDADFLGQWLRLTESEWSAFICLTIRCLASSPEGAIGRFSGLKVFVFGLHKYFIHKANSHRARRSTRAEISTRGKTLAQETSHLRTMFT